MAFSPASLCCCWRNRAVLMLSGLSDNNMNQSEESFNSINQSEVRIITRDQSEVSIITIDQ